MIVVATAVFAAAAGSCLPDDAERLIRGSHRRITHYPALQLAFFAALGAVGAHYAEYDVLIVVAATSLALGCVMHSIADAMTVDRSGIRLLWPISRRGYHLLPWSWRVWVGSRSRSERLFVVIWCGFVLIYAYARFSNHISS
jgi:membrane-bound metal-dependent hydrolase YbcI (DUF457 family)